MELIARIEFWIAVTVAVLLKLAASPEATWFDRAVSLVTAIAMPILLTSAVIDWLELAPETYTIPTAALIALTGEHMTRLILKFLKTTSLEHFLKIWRGK